MKVAAYIRVSTDGQCGDDKFGMDAQMEQIQLYCDVHGHEIVNWFKDEGVSGVKEERPALDQIIYGDVTNPPYEAVIVAKSDRIARDMELYFYFKMLLNKKNIQLISIQEDFGSMGMYAPLLEAFTLFVGQMERDNINKRTSGGRKVKASQGGYSGGKAPFGYKVQNGELVVNEEEAEIVRVIFDLRNNGHTLRDIADTVTKAGFKNRSGKSVSFSNVQNILNNENTYKGMYRYSGSDWVQGKHESIIYNNRADIITEQI